MQTNDAPSFAEIPRLIRTRLQEGERVLLIVLDAFGRHFLERHRDHPLIEHLRIEPLRAQFPTTTTAEMTTLFFDQPVERHGLYRVEHPRAVTAADHLPAAIHGRRVQARG